MATFVARDVTGDDHVPSMNDVGRFVDASGSTMSGGIFNRQMDFAGPGNDICLWSHDLKYGRIPQNCGTNPVVIFTTPNDYIGRPIILIMTDGDIGPAGIVSMTNASGILREKSHVICVVTGKCDSASVFAAVTTHATSFSLLTETSAGVFRDTVTDKTYCSLKDLLQTLRICPPIELPEGAIIGERVDNGVFFYNADWDRKDLSDMLQYDRAESVVRSYMSKNTLPILEARLRSFRNELMQPDFLSSIDGYDAEIIEMCEQAKANDDFIAFMRENRDRIVESTRFADVHRGKAMADVDEMSRIIHEVTSAGWSIDQLSMKSNRARRATKASDAPNNYDNAEIATGECVCCMEEDAPLARLISPADFTDDFSCNLPLAVEADLPKYGPVCTTCAACFVTMGRDGHNVPVAGWMPRIIGGHAKIRPFTLTGGLTMPHAGAIYYAALVRAGAPEEELRAVAANCNVNVECNAVRLSVYLETFCAKYPDDAMMLPENVVLMMKHTPELLELVQIREPVLEEAYKIRDDSDHVNMLRTSLLSKFVGDFPHRGDNFDMTPVRCMLLKVATYKQSFHQTRKKLFMSLLSMDDVDPEVLMGPVCTIDHGDNFVPFVNVYNGAYCFASVTRCAICGNSFLPELPKPTNEGEWDSYANTVLVNMRYHMKVHYGGEVPSTGTGHYRLHSTVASVCYRAGPSSEQSVCVKAVLAKLLTDNVFGRHGGVFDDPDIESYVERAVNQFYLMRSFKKCVMTEDPLVDRSFKRKLQLELAE